MDVNTRNASLQTQINAQLQGSQVRQRAVAPNSQPAQGTQVDRRIDDRASDGAFRVKKGRSGNELSSSNALAAAKETVKSLAQVPGGSASREAPLGRISSSDGRDIPLGQIIDIRV